MTSPIPTLRLAPDQSDPSWVQAARILLRDAVTAHAPAVFTTSLGLEDMVVLDLIAREGLDVEIVTLDTGRLPESTHALIDAARAHYSRPIRVLHPDAATLETFVAREGSNAFYRSVALREACCAIRKVEPLGRALAQARLWITGLRRGQSVTRSDLAPLAFDESRWIWKLSPLADWSTEAVQTYLTEHGVPVNALHAQGYPSIGCAPCTRAVAPGEDARAGRWWWEIPEQRECGLHRTPDGRSVRAPRTESV